MVRLFAVRMATLVLAATIAAALPLNAGAQETTTGAPTQLHYSTSVTPFYGSNYPVAGHLDLEMFPSGIVRGYYHNAFQKEFIQVVGGRDGNYIWFDIGPTLVDLGFGIGPGNRLHVVATMNSDNSFRGQLYPEGTGGSGATPTAAPAFSNSGASPNGQPDQLIFAAKIIEKSSDDYQGTY
ncbi:MAG TPA: hypothetical protein VFE36_01485 [Candidatus Baltobacteraceae bacterium]|jgi:hypothetical protein|nr:hypothetical protein [Candidatus Baltobacteraceae bacterium]